MDGKGYIYMLQEAAAAAAAGALNLDERQIISIFALPYEVPRSYGQAQNANTHPYAHLQTLYPDIRCLRIHQGPDLVSPGREMLREG